MAGRHYLTKPDLNSLYFATDRLERSRGWKQPFTVGHYWRAALVVVFNYGVDTGTVLKSAGFHEPILWRHVSWRPGPPNGQRKESRCGWLYYRRVKTRKQFQLLCNLAGIKPKQNVETGEEKLWVLKDLRKTCATYYDEHMPESSIEILGHSVGGVTHRHCAYRDPLAFKAIMSLPQPMAFNALVHEFGGECPCCRRKFDQA